MDSRKPRVFKSRWSGMWIVKMYNSPWTMVPSYLHFSDWDDAIAIATGKLIK